MNRRDYSNMDENAKGCSVHIKQYFILSKSVFDKAQGYRAYDSLISFVVES